MMLANSGCGPYELTPLGGSIVSEERHGDLTVNQQVTR